MDEPLKVLATAAFVLLTRARVKKIDLGTAGAWLAVALENAAPGALKRLDDVCPERPLRHFHRKKRDRNFTSDSQRKPARIAKVYPIKGEAERVAKLNSVV